MTLKYSGTFAPDGSKVVLRNGRRMPVYHGYPSSPGDAIDWQWGWDCPDARRLASILLIDAQLPSGLIGQLVDEFFAVYVMNWQAAHEWSITDEQIREWARDSVAENEDVDAGMWLF